MHYPIWGAVIAKQGGVSVRAQLTGVSTLQAAYAGREAVFHGTAEPIEA